ncbi:uncharacterized protein LOC112639973 [Camponotus floridanus]|uniref:uncharacterized protein LOC112639973 n=1 Tax=Camponotus floridanus TaxID=104421 RepID=UPI000DC695DA|nr:uncharacterized protein LOC112639973 [Camponotus floridanus]
MRQRWCPDSRLPPADGKRPTSRGRSGRLPTQPRIEYHPRPHLQVHVRRQPFAALIDPGSEVSCIQEETARLFPGIPRLAQNRGDYVLLADNTRVGVTGVGVTLRWHGRTYWHDFCILPGLASAVLIGTDLWAKMGFTLPPPPLNQTGTVSRTNTITVGPSNEADEEAQLRDFLAAELPLFEVITGRTDRAEHRIRLKPGSPIKQRYRPRNPAMQAVINEEVDRMLAEGVIEPSNSAWSSPVVRKKNGQHRFCIDFRRLNAMSDKDAYPLPHITATLDKLRGAKYLTTLDLKSGYWQIPLNQGSRPATAFTVPGKGLYQFTVMPFGLHSAPATFQRLLDTVIGPDLEPNVLVYLDDIIIASKTFSEHLQHLREGIHTDPDKVSAITSWPAHHSAQGPAIFRNGLVVSEVHLEFFTLAAPLTALTKKRAGWTWGTPEDAAFRQLKEALTSTPVLACPDFQKPFLLQTDASSHGLGAVLTQHQTEGKRIIAYASRTLNDAERNYSATELECLAVVWGIRRMRDYLEGYRFTVVTDHQSLKWLQHLENPSGRLGRWLFELQQFDFTIHYRRGGQNQVADALSREPAAQRNATPDSVSMVPTPPQRGKEPTRRVPQQRPAGNLHATPVTAPWQQVSVDLVGPLPRSVRGHVWLLTAQDWFSKWIEMVPLRRATATALAKEVTRRIIYWHECPGQLISDNGTQFTSRQFRTLLASFGIQHRTSPVYARNPVERANRTIKTMISQYFAVNTARHEATGYTPAFLLHGRELAPPHPAERQPTPNLTSPESHRQRLEEAYEVAKVGDKVWKRERPLSSRDDAFNAKLAPRFSGPMEVRRIISPVIMDLRDEHGKWHRHIHVQGLKPQPNIPESPRVDEDDA